MAPQLLTQLICSNRKVVGGGGGKVGWFQCVGPARSTCGVRVNGSSGSEGMCYGYM